MITFLITALKIIFVLGFLILIHEAGHFFVAKLCKVAVNEFSIGFGPIIWKKQGEKTKYTLRLIPLGGFVNLEGEEERSEKEDSYSKASIPKRMAIVIAGGLVNILFALIVYYCLMVSIGDYTSFIIEDVVPNYAAQNAGIQKNDQILKIDNKKIYTKNDIDKIISNSKGKELTLTIKRNDEIKYITLIPTKQEYKSTGIYLKTTNSGDSTEVLTVQAKSAAERAGIKANDEILKINQIEVKNQQEIVDIIQNMKENELHFLLKRGNEQIEISLVPDTQAMYYLGTYFKKAEDSLTNNLYYSLFETRDFVFSIVDNLKMLVIGNVRADQFMGPVGISEVVANTNNLQDFVYILALISLSLGVTNLLPIPALDGGKVLLLLIEAIRRKKISEKVEINIQLIGFAILITLSLYITYHDILRIL